MNCFVVLFLITINKRSILQVGPTIKLKMHLASINYIH